MRTFATISGGGSTGGVGGGAGAAAAAWPGTGCAPGRILSNPKISRPLTWTLVSCDESTRWRSTKHGKSCGPLRGVQFTDCPSAPATDVKVPHSCTVNPDGVGREAATATAVAAARTADNRTTDRAR